MFVIHFMLSGLNATRSHFIVNPAGVAERRLYLLIISYKNIIQCSELSRLFSKMFLPYKPYPDNYKDYKKRISQIGAADLKRRIYIDSAINFI